MNTGTLVLSILAWVVFIYNARVALFGNPLWNIVRRLTPEQIADADGFLLNEKDSGENLSGEMRHILHGFSRWTLLELLLFLLEFGLLVFLLLQRTVWELCAVLLIKDGVVIVLAVTIGIRRFRDDGPFQIVAGISRWLVLLDRLSAAISAVGFLVLVLAMNGLLPGAWGGAG